MIKRNIIKDLANFAKLSNKQCDYLVSLIEKFICDAVLEAKTKEEQFIQLDLGISTIVVDLATGNWKSIPSADMRTNFSKSATSEFNPLDEDLTEQLSKKLLAIIDEVV